LRLGRHRLSQDLKGQLFESQPIRKGPENSIPIVGRVQQPAIRVGKDEPWLDFGAHF
jgi:hypothetical protein